jgi:HSP20 family molecular chaperone IbpA
MEADDQVPAGKELVRPEACFVVKSHIVPIEQKDDSSVKGEKVFVNIVQSTQIAAPVGKKMQGGMQWSLPLSLGPKRFETDKGEALVPTFDACFHPEALKMVRDNKSFRDYVVHTALEQVQTALNPAVRGTPKDYVRREYHVLRGVSYKNGKPAIMMMQSEKMTDAQKKAQQPPTPPSQTKPNTQDSQSSSGNNKKKKNNKKANKSNNGAAVKKGFLNSGSTTKQNASSTSKPSSLITEMAKSVNQESNKQNSPSSTTTTAPVKTSSPSSSTPSSSSAEAAVTAKLKESKGSNENASGEIAPSYHVKERGSYRMSDSMMTRVVQPSRPTELEVVIELPAVATKSNMDLDVSTDKLKFTALRSNPGSSYKLNLKLPYPCEGEKGKAKFDKVRKELKVTIPVIPPKYVEQEEVIGQIDTETPRKKLVETISSSTTTNQNKQESNNNNNDDDVDEKVSEKVRKEQARKRAVDRQQEKLKETKADHSKFLNKAESKEQMTFDIPEGATLIAPNPTPSQQTLALESSSSTSTTSSTTASSAQTPPSSTTTPSSSSSTTTTPPPSSSPSPIVSVPLPPFPVSGAFTPSEKFKGKAPGYVFKLGEEGLGYYRDGIQDVEEVEVEEEVEEDVEVEDVIAPYDFKQMNDVITILVQVPQIDSNSIEKIYKNNQLSISFIKKKKKQENENKNNEKIVHVDDEDDMKRYTLILRTSGDLNIEKCRHDVADKNMIVVLYIVEGGLWDKPLLSVDSEDYKKEFNSNKLIIKKISKKIVKKMISSSSSSSASLQLSEKLRKDLEEKEYYDKLEASKESIEKAAAANSIKSSKQAQNVNAASVPPAVIGGQNLNITNRNSGGNDVVAPTAFQNTIMFELD